MRSASVASTAAKDRSAQATDSASPCRAQPFYLRNGIAIHTSDTVPAFPMALDATLTTPGAAVYETAVVSLRSPITWTFPVNVTTAPGSLTKSGGCEGCPDSGARSTALVDADGFAEFIAQPGHRITAGLSSDLSAATGVMTMNYAFSLWPNGSWEIRELGIYKTEGSFAAGDRFRVAIDAGRVKYYRNGALIYTSVVPPPGAMTFDVTLSSLAASLTDAAIGSGPSSGGTGSTAPPPPPPPPPPVPPPSLPSGVVTIGPYTAIVDRLPYAKPALPAIGPAGSSTIDPVFTSVVGRITDGLTRPGYLNRSYRTPSSPHQNAWSANGSKFYVMSGDGSVIPYSFDASSGTAQRIEPSASGDGGLVVRFYIEPEFSHVNDSLIYGSVSGMSGATLRTIDQFDFTSGTYSRLLDLDALVPGLSGIYVGGVASSGGSVERIMAFFGGTSQDRHHYVVVFDKNNPQNRHLLDTAASRLNGVATSIPLNFSLHHVAMDRSGRYLMLYTTWADQALPRKAAQSYVWDTVTGGFTELNVAALPYGHDAFGYGVSVNQDCCVATGWDAAQWQLRSLATPLQTRDVITNVLTPKQIYLADHATWNNARPDIMTPFISGIFRAPTSDTAWRAWDDEIVAVQTDAAPGADATVWRFAHHRSDIRNDQNPLGVSFWYEPRPNVSPDGRWALFTSNWEKTLGTDPTGDPTTSKRQDVFVVSLEK